MKFERKEKVSRFNCGIFGATLAFKKGLSGVATLKSLSPEMEGVQVGIVFLVEKDFRYILSSHRSDKHTWGLLPQKEIECFALFISKKSCFHYFCSQFMWNEEAKLLLLLFF